MVKLKAVIESSIDDISGIDTDITALSEKFITPIDRIRSIARPAPATQQPNVKALVGESEFAETIRKNFEGIQVNANRQLESRAHAFFRILGFPTMDESGQFYNAGFDPNRQASIVKRQNIDNNILNGPLQPIINKRETQVEDRRLVFAAQDLESTAYALALRHIKNFAVMNPDLVGYPMELDEQIFKVEDRVKELSTFKGADGNPIQKTFSSGQHILKPFIVDPRIADTVMPDQNLICVPFLATKEDTRLSPDKTLLRPGIEMILRQRLKDSGLDENFLKEAERVLSGKSGDDQRTATIIRDSVLALAADNNIKDSAILKEISGFTTIQTATIASLVKTIKAVIGVLNFSITEFDNLRTKLRLQPVPSVEGPEGSGGFIRTLGGGDEASLLEQNISNLKLQQQLELFRNTIEAEKIGDGISDTSSLFAIPVITAVKRDFGSEIQKLERLRDQMASQSLGHIAIIEKVTGEVSGLGLIDVLAIYTALWAIDIDTLIGFLDEEAFNRLYDNNPELRTPAVKKRKQTKLDGLTVLANFENKLFNILSFADKVFQQNRQDPKRGESGDATQG